MNNPLSGDPEAPWRTARRYNPHAPEDREVLADLEQRLSGLNYIETPVWLFDPERCQFLWANPPGLEVWRAESVAEAQLRDIASSQSEAVYALLNDYLEQVRRGEKPSVWVTLNPKGVVQRYFQTHHLFTLLDQRDCLLIEARAEPPAEELLSLASNHSLILGLYDLSGRLISGNPQFLTLTQHNALDEISALLPQEEQVGTLQERLQRQRELRGAGRLVTERGERYFSWEVRLLNHRQGQHHQSQKRVLASFFDQTDRLVAEAETRAAAERARFSSVFEHAPDPVLIVDDHGLICHANLASVQVFGWEITELTDQALLSIIRPYRKRAKEVEEGMTTPTHEGLTHHGEWIPVELKSNPFAVGDMTHQVVSLRDLRSQHRAERERLELTQRMQQSQKMKELGTLAGGVAHYFNNLLAAIIANVEVGRCDPALSGDVEESLNEIERASARGSEMVQRILTFSRQSPVGKAVVSAAPIAQEVIRLVEMAYPPTISFRLVTESPLEGPLPHVYVNSGQLHQSLINLLTNAAQAIGERLGEVELSIEQVAVTATSITLDHIAPGDYLKISVRDNGSGMDEETQRRAFDPFFTTKPIGEGTGLGLAEVHGIAREHGGGLSLESTVGVGTTLSIYLPVHASRPARVSSPQKRSDKALDSILELKVLFVEDDLGLQQVGQRLLKRLGHTVYGFTSPREALEFYSTRPEDKRSEIDVLMSDISMPEMSGLQLAQEISIINPDLPIVLASGRDLDSLDELSIPNAVTALQKPYTRKQLQRALKQAMTGS